MAELLPCHQEARNEPSLQTARPIPLWMVFGPSDQKSFTRRLMPISSQQQSRALVSVEASPDALLRGLSPTAWMILILSACLYIAEGMLKPAWVDELLEFYTDALPSFGAVVHNQLAHPFSLEPAGFHVLVHGLQQVFGANIFAERLPSVLSVVAGQLCLYALARRLAGERAGLFSMLMPPATSVFYYAAEGRTYATLFGLSAVAAVYWIRAIRATGQRRFLLAGLFVCLGVIVTSHFYGIVTLVPFWLAESARVLRRRKLDTGVLLCLLAATACVLLILPFFPAAAAFRSTYFAQAPNWHVISTTYVTSLGLSAVHARMWGIGIGLLALLAMLTLLKRTTLPEQLETVVLVLGFCILPVFGYGVARFTHAFEPRYVLPVMLGVSLLLGVGLSTLTQKQWSFRLLFWGVVLAICVKDGGTLWRARSSWQDLRASLVLHAAQGQSPTPAGEIYVADINAFMIEHYYQPGAYSDRFTLLYSPDVQFDRMHYDAPSRLALNFGQAHTEFHTMPYENYRRLPCPSLVLAIQNGTMDDWLRPVLIDDGFHAVRLGQLRYGSLFRVTPPALLAATPLRASTATLPPALPGR